MKPEFTTTTFLFAATLLFFTIAGTNISYGQSITKNLDSLFNIMSKKGQLNGSVLIAESGKPVYQKAFGYANMETKQPLNNETMFELASVSKQFTAMAIMQLEENGKLKYEDNLKKYFPGLPYEGVTVRHLLQHTSGLPDFLGWDEKQLDTKRINTNKDILNALPKNIKALSFKPGDQLAYSNTNYVLLALIVEKASGLTFSKYLDEKIFKPLGMTNTKVYSKWGNGSKLKNFAFGHVYNMKKNDYVLSDGKSVDKYSYYMDGIAGPYGISSNTSDLLKWDNALYTNKLITKANQDKAYVAARLNNGAKGTIGGIPYGFGWLIVAPNKDRGRILMHTGGYSGYQNIIVRYPDKRKTIIILTNKSTAIELYQLTHAVENILYNKAFQIPGSAPVKKMIQLNTAQIKAVVGSYAIKDAAQVKFKITSEQDKVFAQLANQPKVEIYPSTSNEFFYIVIDAKIKFTMNEKGIAKKLVLFQNGKEIEALKE